MKYKAVIFDLFGTLIYLPSSGDDEKVFSQMSTVLSIPPHDLERLWHEMALRRMKGDFHKYQDCIGHICNQLGVSVDNSQIGTAAKIMNKRKVMTPQADAIEVLSRMKLEGYGIGLISNCSFETTVRWEETYLAPLIDVAVFSCLAGMLKPDPRIYRLATEQLNVEPQECLYVGDGMEQELTGALQIGMHAVQILVDGEDEYAPYREEWGGPKVSSLTEILKLLE